MANALDDVQDTFTSLDLQYNLLLAACHPGTNDKANLQAQYAQAEQNYDSAVNQILDDDDAQVAAISKKLKAANLLVKKATAQMGNIQKVIGYVTSAVNYGSQLLSMVK